MYTRCDASLSEEGPKFVTLRGTDDIEVKDMAAALSDPRCDDGVQRAQELIVALSVGDSSMGPALEMRQLGAQDGCLNAVEPAVDSFDGMLVFDQGAVVCIAPAFGGEVVIVGDDTACIAIGSEILARVKTKGTGDAKGTG